jgi:hypothetical protein
MLAQIAETTVVQGDDIFRVSTTHGVEIALSGQDKEFYETMVFTRDGPHDVAVDRFTRRWESKKEARKGHFRVVDNVEALDTDKATRKLYGFSKRERILRKMEKRGVIFPDCPGCEPFYKAVLDGIHPKDVRYPKHNPSPLCRTSSRATRPHCTCDTCRLSKFGTYWVTSVVGGKSW